MENQAKKEREKKLPFCDSIPRVHQHARYAKTKMDASERVSSSASLYLEELATNHWFLSARGELQLCLPRERRDQRRPVWLCLRLLFFFLFLFLSLPFSVTFFSFFDRLSDSKNYSSRQDRPPSCSRACFFLSRASWTHITREPMYEVTDLWAEILGIVLSFLP